MADSNKAIVSVSHTERTGFFGGKYQETHVTRGDGETGVYSHNENNGGKTKLSEAQRTSAAIKNIGK